MGNFSSNTIDNSFDNSNLFESEINEDFFKCNYKLICSIDCGANGQVLKYEFEEKYYAVKEIKFSENDGIKIHNIKNEIAILQYVNNLEPKLPFFVKFYGYCFFSIPKIAIIYELAEGNLADLINRKFLNLDQSLLFSEYTNLLVTLVKALTFLELHNIAHRDLKPQNVLYKANIKSNKDINFSYILCDFGISKLCDIGTQDYNTTAGSPLFMSPEITYNFYNQIEKSNSNPFKSDVYSLGLLLLKVILNKNLSSKERMIEKDFDPNELDAGPNDMKIINMIDEAYEFFLRLSEEKYKINKFKIILKHMLMYNTKRRPDIFGIYAFMINMGFIHNYEEIDQWIHFKQSKIFSKQLTELSQENQDLLQENYKLKMENDNLKMALSTNSKREFLDKNLMVLKAFKSEKNFYDIEKGKINQYSNSYSISNSPNPYHKRSVESFPLINFKISEYTGKIKHIGKYTIFLEKKIGKGSFGDVFLGTDNIEIQLYAIKERKLNNKFASTKEKFFELLKREVTNAKLLIKHPNIVSFIDIIQEENEVYAICEYCQDGSLTYLLQKNGGKLEENQVLEIFKQILEGFKLLHKNNIIHRNLKPSSILMQNDVAKITGFYFSKHVLDADKKQLMTSFGTPQYMAPEIFESKEYSSKCDIWSLGITLYELLYGDFPWRGKTTHDLIENNIKKKTLNFPETQIVGKKMKDLISAMLVFDQEKRISWNELFSIEI